MPASLSPDVLRRRRSNAETPVGSIPLELLSTVFEYTALSFGDHDAINFGLLPMLINSCSRLRHAAIHTPFIWSFITFRWRDGPHRTAWRKILSVHLERSGVVDLHVLLDVENDTANAFNLHLAIESFKDAIQPHLNRCSKLDAREVHLSTRWGGRPLPSFFPLEWNMERLEQFTSPVISTIEEGCLVRLRTLRYSV